MKPHPDENLTMIYNENEIEPEAVRMAGGGILLRYSCPNPTCDKTYSHKIGTKSELTEFENTIAKNREQRK